VQTRLLQDMEPLDSLPNHSKSCIGCIKWLDMFLKLWFGHYVGWISWYWLKSWSGMGKFLTSHTVQIRLMQDMEPFLDSLPNHSKSCIGCIKWLGMFLKLWFGHYVGWISWYWLKSWSGLAKFLAPHTVQTMLLQDMEPFDSLPNHSKSCIGCIIIFHHRNLNLVLVYIHMWPILVSPLKRSRGTDSHEGESQRRPSGRS
jgi:hypothetical protein